MRIAVTGASGFIGKELLEALSKRSGVSVIGLTRDASGCENTPFCEWRSTDYTAASLKEAIEGADVVIHLAGVRGTEADPEKFAVNDAMTGAILDVMQETGCKRIVFASTMSVYNDDSLMPWDEDIPLGGRSEYGDSKVRCEALIQIFAKETGITYGIARIAQVLGEGEKRRGMMNVFIDTAADHGTLKVMGKSIAKKQYIYVKDLAEILALLAESGQDIIVNAGMQDAYSNLEVAQIVNKVFANPSPIDYDDSHPETGRPFHMDISRLKEELGYVPLDMETALTEMKKARDLQ